MTKLTETEQATLKMDVFRMARDGGYTRAEPLIRDALKLYPNASREEIKEALRVVLKITEAS